MVIIKNEHDNPEKPADLRQSPSPLSAWQRYYITLPARGAKPRRLVGEAGFTLIELVVGTLLTAILVVLIGGILWAGIQGFALGGGDYAAAGELVLFGHYLQQDVGVTPPGGVCITLNGNQPCLTGGSGNTLALNQITYNIKGTDLWRQTTVGGNTRSSAVVHHLDTTKACGGVCFSLLPEAGEVQATVYMDVALYQGAAHQYSGTVTAYDAPVEGLP